MIDSFNLLGIYPLFFSDYFSHDSATYKRRVKQLAYFVEEQLFSKISISRSMFLFKAYWIFIYFTSGSSNPRKPNGAMVNKIATILVSDNLVHKELVTTAWKILAVLFENLEVSEKAYKVEHAPMELLEFAKKDFIDFDIMQGTTTLPTKCSRINSQKFRKPISSARTETSEK